MAIVRYNGVAPVVASLVTVNLAGTQVAATIYADSLLTPLGNPFTADALTGLYAFWADDTLAPYDVVVGMPATPPTTVLPRLPTMLFSGVSPTRTASLVVDDPIEGQVVLLQVSY